MANQSGIINLNKAKTSGSQAKTPANCQATMASKTDLI